jgi:hypothetical protein
MRFENVSIINALAEYYKELQTALKQVPYVGPTSKASLSFSPSAGYDREAVHLNLPISAVSTMLQAEANRVAKALRDEGVEL